MGSRIALIIGVIVLAQVQLTLAATSQITALADSFVSSANPTSNYGSAGGLETSAAGLANGSFRR